ncbi:hypothetical protein [Neisseria sicca]|uniref:hypothetical protein n=1 Tax=Neisseria sicca TaxID=490 RepID=UPI0028E39221|nr:hypothetical protein [Neisseria sicca]
MKKLFLAALVSVTLAGCFGNNFSWTNARQIRQGMSEREVIALMGKPIRIQPSPIGLVYIWGHLNAVTGSVKTTSVIVNDGVVAADPIILGDRSLPLNIY